MNTPGAKPFLKWAGGKRQLVQALLDHRPRKCKTYYEPFCGGGALYWALRPKQALLSDTNARLMKTYAAVRDDVVALIQLLRVHEAHYVAAPAVYFEEQRERPIDTESPLEIAAWMIFLNHTCFNGLYRVNKQGKFNVPHGRYAHPLIADEQGLMLASQALQPVTFRCSDFRMACAGATEGDFVYFDPPYLPTSKTADFTAYTTVGFGLKEHTALRDTALKLKAKGVHVVVSNAALPVIAELYAGPEFTIHEVQARRRISAKAERRANVGEYIIT